MKTFNLKKVVFILSLVSVLLFISRPGYTNFFDTPLTTTKLMWLAGMDFTIDGSPAQIGDEIAVFVPGVATPVGLYIVDTIGQYGTMIIYGDDGTNQGALSGQALTDFRVYDTSTSTLITNVQPVIPGGCVSVFCPPASLPITYQTTGTTFAPPKTGTLLNMEATGPVGPEPVSSILFIFGGIPFAARSLWKRRRSKWIRILR